MPISSLLTPVYTVLLFNGQFNFDKEYNNRSSIDFVISSSVSNVENGGIASGKVKVLFLQSLQAMALTKMDVVSFARQHTLLL